MSTPLVSVIVPTKNSAKFLDACLLSITNQSYKNIEIIVVDNFSTDGTQKIAKKYTENVFEIGPERSAQRNHGASQASGKYVVFIDSDMTLSADVIKSCVAKMENEKIHGIIIPEESFGVGFWAQCKKLERSFYVGVDAIEAARFFHKSDFNAVGGYNELLISGEDWDFSDRIELLGPLGRIQEYIYHDEAKISLIKNLKKKFYYAQNASNYLSQNINTPAGKKRKLGLFRRYSLFFSQPRKLFKDPIYGFGMLFMKTCEFAAAFLGIAIKTNKK